MYIFDFGERLKALRNEKDYTQKELADELHVSQNTILRWENNYKYPTKDNLIQLARVFRVSLDYLAGIERKRSIVVDDLTPEQVTVLNKLVLEFKFRQKGSGLTQRQADILNDVITEFTK